MLNARLGGSVSKKVRTIDLFALLVIYPAFANGSREKPFLCGSFLSWLGVRYVLLFLLFVLGPLLPFLLPVLSVLVLLFLALQVLVHRL